MKLDRDKPTLSIQSQLDVLRFIDHRARANMHTTKIKSADLEKAQRTMGWFPEDIIKCTLNDTTQLAKDVIYRDPLRHHMKSRYPYLNCTRIKERYATDTMFASKPALGGKTCVQVYVGMQSNFL